MSGDPMAMEPEVLEDTNGYTPKGNENDSEVFEDIIGSTLGGNKNDLILRPVSPHESGEGLPYAPENWPNPGDNWIWRVGKRVAITGYFVDRFLYPPRHIGMPEYASRKGQGFPSKLSVERYIQSEFPNADVDAFFASFSWKIPGTKSSLAQGRRGKLVPCPLPPSRETKECSASDSQFDIIVGCNAGNKNCNSLSLEEIPSLLKSMSCDFCCSESRFCRHCCCILCWKIIDTTRESYSYIKCEATVGDGYICGHHAHLKCGLKSYMAGTVGGSIGLDAEYYCRCCDARMDLVSHVERFLQLFQSTDLRDDFEEFLDIGFCVLRGSHKMRAKELLRHIELNNAKVKLEEIWKMEENISEDYSGFQKIVSFMSISMPSIIHTFLLRDWFFYAPVNANSGEGSHDTSGTISSDWTISTPFDHWTESLKLEDEVDQVLQALKRSQEFEYNLAEEKLLLHKNYLHNLFQQLDKEQTELRHQTSTTGQIACQDKVTNRVEQIKREVKKLKRIEKVANGFGITPKDILKEDYGFNVP